MSRMIPIKIADMAVESCNKEITRLLFEKAELQGRVIALEAELESEKAAHKALRASSFVTAVPSEEYEKLKAEVERLRKAGDEVIHEWSSGHGTDFENFTKALWVWTVAKEGKQS